MSMADRIAVMNEGVIEQLGTPFEIYRRPASRFVADFIGDANFLDVEVDGDIAVLADGTRSPCSGGGVRGRATLMLRPESLRLVDPDVAPAGAMHGRTVKSSFLGTRVRVAVACEASSVPVMVALHGDEAITLPEPDRPVALWWAAEDAMVLPPREESP